MSTYYALACDVCRKQTDFTTTSIHGMSWMAGAEKHVPEFFNEHSSCGIKGGNAIRVICEHDADWCAYEDYPPDGGA